MKIVNRFPTHYTTTDEILDGATEHFEITD